MNVLRMACVGALIFSLGTSSSQAQGPGWTPPSTVVQIVNTSNGGINVRLSPELSGCVSQSGYGSVYASISPTHPSLNRIKADAMVSLLTGAQMAFYLGDSQCNVAETLLYAPTP